ncbi:MAG: SIS domain-containing protein, partial [Thiomicrorhabdus sp.]|nr:SIS domain-containing protein [Thiomicrorhabdus sp.]
MPDDHSILKGLYPFMEETTKQSPTESNQHDAPSLVEDSVLLTSIQQKAQESIETKLAYFKANEAKLVTAAKMITEVYQQHGKMLTMGNGGSNCDASHLAVEFLHPVTAGRQALPAINLGADATMVTAASNDLGYENAFMRQLIAHAQPKDILIGFSTSGCSENMMAAYAKAKEMKLITFGLVGGDGGDMKASGLVDYCLVVDSDSIHRIQEVHVACYH